MKSCFSIRLKRYKDLFVDAKAQGKTNETKIIVWSHTAGKNQVWNFDPSIQVISYEFNNLAVDARAEKVVCWETEDTNKHQKWTYNGKCIISLQNNHYLSAESTKKGAEVLLKLIFDPELAEWELIDAKGTPKPEPTPVKESVPSASTAKPQSVASKFDAGRI